MAPAFVASTPLTARTQLQGGALCQSRPATRRASRTSVQMVAEKKKDGSIVDWLYGKFMHNALWDGDQEIGFEPYWKEIETTREEKKKEVYESMKSEKDE